MLNNLTHLNVEITKRCNQKCAYCFNNSGPGGSESIFTFDEWKVILQQLVEGSNLKSIHITGGEPFTFIKIIDLVKYCNSLGLSVSILSNGYRVSDYCEQYPNTMASLSLAQISLDSMNQAYVKSTRRYEDAFIDAISAIKSLRKLGVPVEISSVVTANISEKEFHELETFAERHNCRIIFRDLEKSGRGKWFARNFPEAISSTTEFNTSDKFYYLPSERKLGVKYGIRTVLSNGEIFPKGILFKNNIVSNLARLI